MTRSLFDIIKVILNAAWRRRYLILVPFFLMIPISIFGSKFAPKTYEAKTILLLQETGKDNPFLKDFVVGLNLKDRIFALQTLLRSEHVLLNVLRDLRGKDIEKDAEKLAIEMRQLSGNISVQLVGSDLIELKLKGTKPHGMGKTLSAVSTRFLERLLSPERSTLGSTQSFLKEQLEQRRKELADAERTMFEFKRLHADKLPAVYSANVTRVSAMKQRLQDKEMELSAAMASFNDMRKQLASTNPIVGRLEESIIAVTGELTALRSRYTVEHSDVQAAERKLARLSEERQAYIDSSKTLDQADLDRLWSIAAGHQAAQDKSAPPLLISQLLRLQESQAKRVALEQDVQQLSKAVNELQDSISAFAPIEQQQMRLEKDVAAAREHFESFKKRHDSASTSFELGRFEAPERIKIIDLPADPTIPTTPPTIIFIIAGIVAGLVLGAGLAVVAELLDQRIRTTADFVAVAGVPVLARLPRALELERPRHA